MFNWDLQTSISDLLEKGLIQEDSAEHIVAQHVMFDGYESLTMQQQLVYARVENLLKARSNTIAAAEFENCPFYYPYDSPIGLRKIFN